MREALGTTPQATAAIWRFLLDVDWMSVVEVPLAPPDHPLFLLLALPRRAQYRMGDGLWMRLVDLSAALSGRAYGEGGPLVFEVRDAICEWNDGRWRLDGGACERTDAEPDLALDVSVLGSAYLGAVSFTQLRDAGRGRGAARGSDPPRGCAVRVAPAALVPRDLLVGSSAFVRRANGSLERVNLPGPTAFEGRRDRVLPAYRPASPCGHCGFPSPDESATAPGADRHRLRRRSCRVRPWGYLPRTHRPERFVHRYCSQRPGWIPGRLYAEECVGRSSFLTVG